MKAEDTVISEAKLLKVMCSYNKDADIEEMLIALISSIASKQAEISFKAGQESRCDWHKPLPIIISESFTEGKQAGIREVVEFVNDLIIGIEGCKFEERLDGDKGCIVLDMNENQWQAKLKDWGINEEVSDNIC